jgi:2-polyprenyl-3-methyl-5-hydroxy-6-metoxy-1,4-benzoquinol methylase
MSQSGTPEDERRLEEARRYWDNAAAAFDDEPDHGLLDPQTLHAWTTLLRTWMPAPAAAVLDMGCGTGSLTVVLAGLGHDVTGVDISPAMVERAQAKAKAGGHSIEFHSMDAAAPQLASWLAPQSFDVIVCRHLLWALAEPDQALRRWAGLLKPAGRLLLIEGFWSTGAGMHATELVAALPAAVTAVSVQNLSAQPAYWGKTVTDERYAVIADLSHESDAT